MTLVKQIVRLVLFIHGVLNIMQGTYGVFRPAEFAGAAGAGFLGAPEKAIQSIGLGSIGVGTYGALGAMQNRRQFYTTTMFLRLLFGIIAFTQWGWHTSSGVIMYEFSVAAVAAVGSQT